MSYSAEMTDSDSIGTPTNISINVFVYNAVEVHFNMGGHYKSTAEFNAKDLDTFIAKLQEARKAIV